MYALIEFASPLAFLSQSEEHRAAFVQEATTNTRRFTAANSLDALHCRKALVEHLGQQQTDTEGGVK